MWFNPLMTAVLRSPFHALLSRNTMLISVPGRKSGKVYATPVNYVPVGDELWTVSLRKRTWWRNLRGGAAVTLLLRGRSVQTTAQVVETQEDVAKGLGRLVEAAPAYGRYLGVGGSLEGPALQEAARERVLIKARGA